jgi:DNA-binding response OmpR family regulator
MVVDDDEFILEIVKKTLEDEGFSVTSVEDGTKALDEFTRVRPDLVILDIRMPGVNGYDILYGIRKQSEVPIIMLTGITEPDALSWTLDLGANDYIKKPFLPHELAARVRAKLRRAGL